MEELGWMLQNANAVGQGYPVELPARLEVIKEACRIGRLDPFAKRITNTTVHFTFGEGLSNPVIRKLDEDRATAKARIREEGQEPREQKAQERINAFWRVNKRSIFGRIAQYQRQFEIHWIGDLFLRFVKGTDGIFRVRPMDYQEITQIVTDPDDYLLEKEVRREYRPMVYDQKSNTYKTGKPVVEYYPVLDLDEDMEGEEGDKGRVLHMSVNRLVQERFGRPAMEPILGWLKGRKQIGEDTLTLFASLAKLAWKEKVTGGRRAFDTYKSGIQTAAGNTLRVPPSPGSIYASTEGRDLEAIRKPNIGGDATDVGSLTMNPIAAGADLPEHYFGNPSNSNLATATALEYPVLKAFQWNRGIWTDLYDTAFQYQLREDGYDDLTADTDFPPLGARDIGIYVKAMLDSESSGMVPREAAAKAIMQALTIEDVDYWLNELRGQWNQEEEDAQNAPLPVQQKSGRLEEPVATSAASKSSPV